MPNHDLTDEEIAQRQLFCTCETPNIRSWLGECETCHRKPRYLMEPPPELPFDDPRRAH